MIEKLMNITEKIEECIIAWTVILMFLLLIINVFCRFLGNSLTFAEEIGAFFLVVMTFIGLTYCARKDSHISMTAIIDILPGKIKKIIYITNSFILAPFLFYVSILSFKYTMKVFTIGRVTPALSLPMWILTIIIPIGICLAGIQYLLIGIKNIQFWYDSVYVGTDNNLELDKKM